MWLVRLNMFALVMSAATQPVFAQRVVRREQLPHSVTSAISRSSARMVGSRAGATLPPSDTTVANDTTPTRDTTTRIISPTATSVTFHPGEFLAASIAGRPVLITKPRPAGRADSVSVDSFVALPERVIGVAADSNLAVLRPAFLPQGELRYAPSIELFRGGFSIGLEDSVHTTERRKLSGGFHFQFGGDADSVSPRGLDIDHTNLPLAAVEILAHDPPDSLRLQIITAADVRGTSVWLRARPALAIGLVPSKAQGYGLQRIPITVSVLGTRRATPIAVKLSADRGSIEPDTVLVTSGMITTVSWRTEGTGPAMIQARATGTDDGRATVYFAFPLIFLIAALLGGAAGAALKSLNSSGLSRALLVAIPIGMLGGLVAAVVYYAIGVSLFKVDVKVPFFNEGAVFSLGVLAGLLGVALAPGQPEEPR